MTQNYYSILLGAGASADAGVPTSGRLIEDFLGRCSSADKQKISEILPRLDQKSKPNVEDIALKGVKSTLDPCCKLL